MLGLYLALAIGRTPPTLLDHVRQALSVPAAAAWSETRVSGTAQYYGLKHQYSFVFLPDGRFVQKFTGPLGETFGFDEDTFWEIDRSRTVVRLDFEDRDRELALSLLLTSLWLDPKAPVAISEDGNTLHLKLQTSGQEETVHIDPVTWLPIDASFQVSSGILAIKVSDWRPAGNLKIPMHVEITDAGLTDKLMAETAEAGTAETLPFQVPAWKPDDVSFDATKGAIVEAKRAVSGHVLVHPLLNGKDVGWFILDSGAEVSVIDKTTADGMKLESVGKEPLTGVGGNVMSTFRPVETLSLGPATLRNLMFCEFDLGQIGQFLGIKLGGVLGADFLRRTIVAIDFNGPSVEIHGRDGFTLSSGTWLPLRFSSGNPAVEATMDGAPKAWYRFDTGADGTLTLHTQFVTRWKLLDGRKTVGVSTGGVGGLNTAQSGKVKWFELAGHRFENPTVLFSTSTQGAFAEPYLAGNIGQDFMKPFRVVLDFSGYRIALIPRVR